MSISPSTFRRAFDRFQAIQVKASGKPLVSFSEPGSLAFKWEDYKNGIPYRAKALMQAQKWTKSMIGTGDIAALVIEAIELPGNNLVQWEGRKGPASRAHLKVLEGRDKPATCRELETLFFNLYNRRKADKNTFEAIVNLCGKRYEVLGYLFFIASPDRFLPLRTRTFDKAFGELGLSVRTEGNCSWENYLAFIAAVRDVQYSLHAEGIATASLLDAHSFCWILARHETMLEPVTPTSATIVPFNGRLQVAPPQGEFTPNDEAETRNMHEESLKRQASGLIAEEVALDAERARLHSVGRGDLADRVKPVSNRPGLGYDIHSFEEDGTVRFIEVKNVSKGNRFFLSEGEWLNSRARTNYWFYLVSGTGTPSAKVTCLSAHEVSQEHLQPVEYLVRYVTK